MLVIGVVAALIVAATTATFSDQVTSTGNTFTAGTLQLSTTGTANDCSSRVHGGDTATTNGQGQGVDGNTGCATGIITFSTGGSTANGSACPGNLAPGDVCTPATAFSLKNIGSLNGKLDTVSANVTMDAAHTGCATTNFTVGGLPSTGAPINAGATLATPITLTFASSAPNACQGAIATVDITFHLVQAA